MSGQRKSCTAVKRRPNKYESHISKGADAGRSQPKERFDCHRPIVCRDEVVPVSIKQRTRALVRGLRVCLQHHKAKTPILGELSDQLSQFLNECKDEEQWLARSKDVLTYPKALYLKNELPVSPDRRFTPRGILKKWMSNRLNCFNKSNTHLWYTWLQTKRATLPVSDDFVEKTYAKHLKVLTKPDDGDDETIEKIMNNPAMSLACRNMADAVERVLERDCDFTKLQPSTNAAFESKRSEGGQQGYLIRLTKVPEPDIRSPELVRMDWFPTTKNSRSNSGCVLETYEPIGRQEWSSMLDMRSDKQILSATIQAVLEPMKVRVISKGNGLEYYQCRLFQKAMHSSLRDLAPFRLIGRPFEPLDINDLRRKAEPHWRWLSIDYSAATDNLSWKYSGRIFSEVISNLPERAQELLMKVLGSHDLYYPKGKEIELRGRMTRGQLMGSVLSFPILCLANFGVYCHVMESFASHWSISDIWSHVLVNGDDMLYAAPEGTFKLHREIAARVGLDMSVGKAYEHHTYLNINSVACHSDLQRSQAETRRIDFLNIGLLFGQHKVQSHKELADDHHTLSGVAECANEVLKGCYRDHASVLKQYISLHSKEIQKEVVYARYFNSHGIMMRKTFQKDLFLPISLGGLGIHRPKGFKSQPLALPRLYASYLIDKQIQSNEIINTQRPLLGFEPKSFCIVPSVPWFQKAHEDIDEDVDLRTYQRMCTEWRASIFEFFRRTGFQISVPNQNHVR